MKKIITVFALIFTVAINAQTAKDYFNKGNTDMGNGAYQSAIMYFSKAIELNPKDAQSYGGRAFCKKSQKDYKGAIEDYTKAIEYQPNFSSAYSERGECKFGLNDFKGDIEDQDKAIQQYPQGASMYHYLKGAARCMLTEYKEAIVDFNKSIELNNNYDMPFLMRGKCKYKLNDKAGACGDFKKAQSLGNTDAITLVRSLCK